jgi:hypothetical protein
VLLTMAALPGSIKAPPTPWTTRPTNRTGKVGAKSPTADAAVKANRPDQVPTDVPELHQTETQAAMRRVATLHASGRTPLGVRPSTRRSVAFRGR